MAIVYLCGHGSWQTAGEGVIFTTLPAETTLSVYVPAGRFLGVPDAIAVIEQAQGAKRPDQIFRAYQGCPDTTLHPATEFSGLFLQAAATGGGQVHMVLQDTKLSALLQLYAGNDLHWIACRGHNLGRQQAVEDLFPRVAW